MNRALLLSLVMVLAFGIFAFGTADNSQLASSQLSTNSTEKVIGYSLDVQSRNNPIVVQKQIISAQTSERTVNEKTDKESVLKSIMAKSRRSFGMSANPNVNLAEVSRINSGEDIPSIQTTYFTEGFENSGSIPPGWADVPGGQYPWLYNNGSGAGMPGSTHGGNYLAYFNVYSFPAGTNDSLISPPITLTGNGNYQLVFWSWDDADPMGIIDSVYVKIKFGNGSFNYLATAPYDSSGWIQNIIPFRTSASTVRIEFIGHSEYGYTCPCIDDIAVMDVASEGRCCYGDPQNPSCAVNTQSACNDLGGSWAMGENCASLPCIAAPANDSCTEALAISGPYPQTVFGTTVAATVDCPELFNWNGVWYTVYLPYALNDVSIDFSPTCNLGGMDWLGIVYMADCSCGDVMLFDSWWEFCQDGSYYAALTGTIPGPTTIYFPCWAADASMGGIDFGFTVNVRDLVIPLNDSCANAEAVGYVAYDTFSTIAATFDGPGACQTSSNIWYIFTAPETGLVDVSLCGSNYNTKMAVYDGAACPPPDPEPIPLQGGDTFADAVDIGTANVAYSGSTAASNHDITLSCDYNNISPDVVYSYSPASNDTINVALCGSNFDTILGIFMDNETTEIGCNDDNCGAQSRIDGIPVTAGHTYYFVIGGFGGAIGDYVISIISPAYTLLACNDDFCGSQSQIRLQAEEGHQYLIEVGGSFPGIAGDGFLTIAPPLPPPPNDSCINADNGGILVPGQSIQFTGTTVGAAPDCDLGYPEVWVTFTINECQNVTIDFCGTNPVFDMASIIIEESCCGSFSYASYWDTTNCYGNWVVHFFGLEPGQYWYPIFQGSGSNGPYVLNVHGEVCPPPPGNDNCESVTPLNLVPGTPLIFTGNNTGATSDCELLGTPDVWHAFTIAQDMRVTIDYCGSDSVFLDYFWIIAKDCPCSDYSLRNYADTTTCDDGRVTMVFNSLLSGTYYIPVLSIPSQWGNYTMHVSAAEPPPPPVNACEGPSLIYTNGAGDGEIILSSQCDLSREAISEIADDFILPGSGQIEIGKVVSYCGFWNGSGQSPDLFTGINLTIYADNAGVPGGQPIENIPDCFHQENIPGGIIASFEFEPGEFLFGQMSTGAWQIEMPLDTPVTLNANTTYWLGFQPEMDSATGGQCGAFTTSNVTGSPAKQGFPLLGVPFWSSTDYDVAFCLLGGGCAYIPGDINNNGAANGIDVVFGVSYFKGGNPPPINCAADCPNHGNPFFAAGDVNGNCAFNGIDITFFVAYLKGIQPALQNCPDCPPASLATPSVMPIKSSEPKLEGDIGSLK